MELAIGVMFLMIAFTIMLLSTAGLQNRHRNDDYKDFNQMIEINNVGERVLSLIENNQFEVNKIAQIPPVENEIEYHYTVLKTGNEYKIYRGLYDFAALGGLEPVLTIETDGNKITSWK